MAAALGASSVISCIRLAIRSLISMLMPVRLPPGRLRLPTRPALTGSLATMKTIGMVEPRVCAKLEELGVDVVRAKLVWIMNVTTLGQQDHLENLGDGVSASRRQMQEWLRRKTARESRWVKVGTVAAVCGTVAAVCAAALAFLA